MNNIIRKVFCIAVLIASSLTIAQGYNGCQEACNTTKAMCLEDADRQRQECLDILQQQHTVCMWLAQDKFNNCNASPPNPNTCHTEFQQDQWMCDSELEGYRVFCDQNYDFYSHECVRLHEDCFIQCDP
jgi:hypothetical protein